MAERTNAPALKADVGRLTEGSNPSRSALACTSVPRNSRESERLPVMVIELRTANDSDLAALSDLALRSKGHWGYDEAFLAACEDELTVTRDRLDDECVIVAVDAAGSPVGFFALVMRPPGAELNDLFVEDGSIHTGSSTPSTW